MVKQPFPPTIPKVIACVFVQLLCFVVADAQRGQMTAQVILKRVEQRYASFSSHQDVGIVLSTWEEATGGRIDKLPFKTFFSRPSLFRFEWIDYDLDKSGRLSVVWSNAAGTFAYWEPDEYEKKDSLELGIAAATGVSSGSAATIPQLLMPQFTGWKITRLKKPVLVGKEVFEGQACYRIKGLDSLGDVNELWINQQTFLIYKITTHMTIGSSSVTEDEIHRDIRINRPIAAANFEFKPPIALQSPDKSEDGSVLYAPELPTWTEFSSPEGRFKVMMPGPPVPQTFTFESPQGEMVHRSHIATKGGVMCMVDYTDLPKQFADSNKVDELFNEARDRFVKDSEGKLAKDLAISLDGYPGREVRVQIYGSEAVARFYLVGDRLYQLAVTAAGFTENSESERDRFLSSFKITPAPKPVARLMSNLTVQNERDTRSSS